MNYDWPVLYCSGCGAEITGAPFTQDEQFYCCSDCAEGIPCECALVFEDEYRSASQDIIT